MGGVNAYLALLLGLACAGGGGELFVRGTVGLARAARISPGIIAATVAAFATSSPELTVAVTSAVEGVPEISLGNVTGANVINVALILGVALLLAPIAVPLGSIRRDIPVALLAPVATGVLLVDGSLSRLDGVILLAGFAAWMIAIVREGRDERSHVAEVLGDVNPRRALRDGIAGLALLIAAGHLIVQSGTDIARSFGFSDFVIGATIVAIGTTLPELVTMLVARLRGHDEVGLGAVLGSNIFNGLFIVGVAATVHPINVGFPVAAPVLALGAITVALTWPPGTGRLDRWRGGMLLAVLAVYVGVVAQ